MIEALPLKRDAAELMLAEHEQFEGDADLVSERADHCSLSSAAMGIACRLPFEKNLAAFCGRLIHLCDIPARNELPINLTNSRASANMRACTNDV